MLTTQQVAEIIQAEEEIIPSNKEQQEPVQESVPVDLEEDFTVRKTLQYSINPISLSLPRLAQSANTLFK